VVLPNALECLLISDPDTDKAAASMSVSVGYFCDPDGLEGLAHFLGQCSVSACCISTRLLASVLQLELFCFSLILIFFFF